jgi:hypothetical protein
MAVYRRTNEFIDVNVFWRVANDSENSDDGGNNFDGYRSDNDSFHGRRASPGASPEPMLGVQGGEDVRIHPLLNGN